MSTRILLCLGIVLYLIAAALLYLLVESTIAYPWKIEGRVYVADPVFTSVVFAITFMSLALSFVAIVLNSSDTLLRLSGLVFGVTAVAMFLYLVNRSAELQKPVVLDLHNIDVVFIAGGIFITLLAVTALHIKAQTTESRTS